MNIRTYLVNCISNNTNIVKERYDFEYAGVCGYSELIGWKIIFFRRKKTDSFLSAICFSDIYSKEEIKFCNYIFEALDSEIRLECDVEEILELFGKESYVAYTYDNIRRYEYLFDKKTFASFGFSENKKIVEVEIIFDKDMANDVFKCRKDASMLYKNR